jgi:hypothetical protein
MQQFLLENFKGRENELNYYIESPSNPPPLAASRFGESPGCFISRPESHGSGRDSHTPEARRQKQVCGTFKHR